MLSVVGKIYVEILIDGVRRVTGGLIDVEQENFRERRRCVDQILTLKQIDEKAKEKKRRAYLGFIDLGRGTIGLVGKLCGKC